MKSERLLAISEDVLARASHGSEEAWAEVYSIVRPFILGLCKGTYGLSREDSYDVSHNIILQLFRSLEKIDNLGAWICGAVRRQAGGLHRARSDRVQAPVIHSSSVEDAMGFWHAYSCLSTTCRQLFHHTVFEGLSHREAAGKIGIPPGSFHHVRGRCLESFLLMFLGGAHER